MAEVEDSPGVLRYNADGSRSVSVDDNYDRLSRELSKLHFFLFAVTYFFLNVNELLRVLQQ